MAWHHSHSAARQVQQNIGRKEKPSERYRRPFKWNVMFIANNYSKSAELNQHLDSLVSMVTEKSTFPNRTFTAEQQYSSAYHRCL
ncbi:hypothetical protein TNCV_2260161 [Trichonephila clavipes]|nr:hypothetical protein TNCV_2260161 [Trichonephila clavipes]